MNENDPSCFRFGVNTCPQCKSDKLIKSGKTATGKQRYCCKECNKRFIIEYSYQASSNCNPLIKINNALFCSIIN